MGRVVVLGGGGYEGSTVARKLAQQPDVEQVILADNNQRRADEAATGIGEKAVGTFVDLDDRIGLVEVMREADLVVNMIGPFFIHGTKALSAAIEARRDYVDIADDWDVTRDLLALDEEARSAGVTALINMGSSPGLLNVFAKHAAGRLDQVEEIRVAWCSHYLGGKGGPSAGIHAFHMMEGRVPQYLDGNWVYVAPGEGREIVEFAGGPAECFYVGHAEPLTLPLYIKGVRTVVNKGAVLPSWVSDDMFKMIEFGLGGREPMKIRGDNYVVPLEVALRLQAQYLEKRDLGKPQGGFQTKVVGLKDGKRTSLIYDLPAEVSSEEMGEVTACPAATGALMVLRGEHAGKGVWAPEVLDATRFLSLVAEFGIEWTMTESVLDEE
jgi:lysine 6-dehydrogenase